MKRMKSERGAAAVEFALVLPLLLLLLLGIVEFGRVYNAQMQLTAAARDGARVMTINSNSAAAAAEARAAVIASAPALAPAVAANQIDIAVSPGNTDMCYHQVQREQHHHRHQPNRPNTHSHSLSHKKPDPVVLVQLVEPEHEFKLSSLPAAVLDLDHPLTRAPPLVLRYLIIPSLRVQVSSLFLIGIASTNGCILTTPINCHITCFRLALCPMCPLYPYPDPWVLHVPL